MLLSDDVSLLFFQTDCSTTGRRHRPKFRTSKLSGGMMVLALLPLLKKVGLLPELPPSFQAISRQNALTHTHTQNRQLPQRHHSPLFILLKKILLSRYHLVVVDGMTHKTHNIFWGQMNDFVVSRTCPKLGHIFQKRSRTQSGMR